MTLKDHSNANVAKVFVDYKQTTAQNTDGLFGTDTHTFYSGNLTESEQFKQVIF